MVRQGFPRKTKAGALERLEWDVDLDAAAAFLPAPRAGAPRLLAEAEQMQRFFPRWILTLGAAGSFVRCGCGGPVVFRAGLSCAVCERAFPRQAVPRGQRLAWFGTLPPIGLGSLSRLRDRIRARPPAGHVVGDQPGIGLYLLVPLVATYPAGFPDSPVEVSYLPGFFDLPGMPARAPSHTCHLLSDGVMCLFAPGQWRREESCREVLQQRAYAHAVKMLTWADGRREAFAIVTRP